MIRGLLWRSSVWAVLMALAGAEFVISGLRMAPEVRPVLLAIAVVKVAIVALAFMNLARAPTIAKGFAVATVFWLIVLFGLGTMDALTRTWYPVLHYNPY